MSFNVSIIEPKSELVDIAPEVLVTGVVVNAVQPALEDSPNAFNAVGVDAVPAVFLGAINVRNWRG